MENQELTIVFMGTPEFAVPSLSQILEAGYTVAEVVTNPDKPAGRGKKLTPPPVKRFAQAKNLPISQPKQLKDPQFIHHLQELKPDLIVVVAFRILPKEIWSIPAKGTFNLHASLLPQYRGAAPINWAIINGETISGVTTFFIDEHMDTGHMLMQKQVSIEPDETAGELHDKLMHTGADLVVQTIQAIERNDYVLHDQSEFLSDNTPLKKAPKIHKEDCRINWHQEAKHIHDFIRGLSPFPGAFTEWVQSNGNRQVVKIFRSQYEIQPHQFKPGTIRTDGKNYLKIACHNGWIQIFELQAAGKKRLSITSFLVGTEVSQDTQMA